MDSSKRLRAHHPGTRAQVNRIAVGFDFDHTLGLDHKLERVTFLWLLEQVISRGGYALGTPEQETRAIDQLLEEQRSGVCSIDDAVKGFIRARSEFDPQPYVKLYREHALQSVPDFVRPLPGAIDLLAELRTREVPVAILTNGWSPLQQRKAAAIGFIGPVLASDQIGALKPDPHAFAALQAAFDLPVQQILYLGDNPRTDVAGSVTAGMRGVWLDAENIAYPQDVVGPSATIHKLAELLALL
ncbi:MAG: HAD family hydrolase [Candidatus Eremiobacteraeota bacterium]|nr:HAD family hydrolase [Candidatus Eremiobacteraeota bacterium]